MLLVVDSRIVQRVDQETSQALSPREHQLLVLAAQGFTDHGIAHKLGISLATVGTYWGRIRIKMGPLNRTELVAHFLKEAAARESEALRQENLRLIEDLGEHVRSNEQLQASLAMFQSLVELAPDAILMVNPEGKIELANDQAAVLFGYAAQELPGLLVTSLVPERFRSAHDGHRRHYLENPGRRRMGEHSATHAVKKDGTEFPMAATLSTIETPRGLFVTCIVRDLTGRIAEQEITSEDE